MSQVPVESSVAPTKTPPGRLGAYIPVTSAATPLGYHPDFVKNGGWKGFDVYLDIWTATAKGHEITPAKGY